MAYLEATLIVDGALDEIVSWDVAEQDKFGTWLDNVKRESAESVALFEVFTLDHNHDDDVEECVCAQYVNDHRPLWLSSEAE